MKNDFTCPSNHSFMAVAKLRARCPHCGLMARRDFQKTEAVKKNENDESSKVEAQKEETVEKPIEKPKQLRKPVIVKQGRQLPRKPPIIKKKAVRKPITIPKVRKLPKGSYERKVAEIVQPKSFWEQVKETYFR